MRSQNSIVQLRVTWMLLLALGMVLISSFLNFRPSTPTALPDPILLKETSGHYAKFHAAGHDSSPGKASPPPPPRPAFPAPPAPPQVPPPPILAAVIVSSDEEEEPSSDDEYPVEVELEETPILENPSKDLSVECDRDSGKAVVLRHKWTGGMWVWPEGQESPEAIEAWFEQIEGAGTTLLDRIFRRRKTPQTHYFIDVGSHQGLFSMLAGRAGYPSLAFDLQRRCARLFHCAAYWNNYKRHEIRLGYVTDAETAASGKLIEADSESCVGGRSPRQFPSFTGERIMVPPIDLTEFILKRGVQVAALKIDTEGYEPIILRSLVPLLALRAIPDLIVEFTPYAWSSLGVSVEDFLMGTVRDMYEEWGMTAHLLHNVPDGAEAPLDLESYITVFPTFELFAEQVRQSSNGGWIDVWFSLDPEAVLSRKLEANADDTDDNVNDEEDE